MTARSSVQENKSKHTRGTARVHILLAPIISKFDLCEGGGFPTAIFNSDIQQSVDSFSCFISFCPFVALYAATYAENSHIVLSCRYYKALVFNLLCVLTSGKALGCLKPQSHRAYDHVTT